jgi:hypothetical protein
MYHIGLYTCNGLKYTSEVQRGAPLGGHHRWENNKRKRAPLRIMSPILLMSLYYLILRLYIYTWVCVCVYMENGGWWWKLLLTEFYEGVVHRVADPPALKIYKGGIRRSWLTRSFLAFAVPWLMADVCDVNPPFLWLHGRQCATHHQQGRRNKAAAPGIRAARPSIHPATTATS